MGLSASMDVLLENSLIEKTHIEFKKAENKRSPHWGRFAFARGFGDANRAQWGLLRGAGSTNRTAFQRLGFFWSVPYIM